MAHERLRPEFTFDKDKIKQLKEIAPECFEDGKINFETLRQILGDQVEDEEDKDLEHFGLFWPGKRKARRIASKAQEGTLEPSFGEGMKPNGSPDKDGVNESNNIFIEGENLEVLKLLQKSYSGKIKMIYIDPPYNTGNDFVYDDDFTEPLQEYLKRTGQVDEEGKPQTTNKRSDGRFHSKWLSMIYPRLRLASNLLEDKGFIFVSIDDNEYSRLKLLMDEVFGEENFLSSIIVQSNKRGQTYQQLAKTHEYLLCYTKSTEGNLNQLEKTEDDLTFEDSVGSFSIRELRNRNPKFGRFNRPNLFYPIYISENSKDKDGFCSVSLEPSKQYKIETVPLNSARGESCWRWGKQLLSKNINADPFNSNVVAKQRKDGGWNIYEKYRKSTYKEKTIWTDTSVITEQGTIDTKKLGLDGYFDFPKPVELIKKCIQLATDQDDIILDFFAGSSTTAHAVFRLNEEDGSNRKFICIQIPDLIADSHKAYQNGYRNIAQISRERIRLAHKECKAMSGFRSFALRTTNYKNWKHYEGASITDLDEKLTLFSENPLADDWSKESLLVEILLLEGFVLSCLFTKEAYRDNEVIKISDDYCEHHLLVCLDKKIHDSTIKALDFKDNGIFICLDSAISNVDKLRLSDKGLIKTI